MQTLNLQKRLVKMKVYIFCQIYQFVKLSAVTAQSATSGEIHFLHVNETLISYLL